MTFDNDSRPQPSRSNASNNSSKYPGFDSLDHVLECVGKLMSVSQRLADVYYRTHDGWMVSDCHPILSDGSPFFGEFRALSVRFGPLLLASPAELAPLNRGLMQAAEIAHAMSNRLRGPDCEIGLEDLHVSFSTVVHWLGNGIRDIRKTNPPKDDFDFLRQIKQRERENQNQIEVKKPLVIPTTPSCDGDDAATPTSAYESDTSIPTVSAWSELSIGIHAQKGYYGFIPSLEAGAIAVLNKGRRLELAGDRWPVVLELLAESKDGYTVSLGTLIQRIGPADVRRGIAREGRAYRPDLEAAYSEELQSIAKSGIEWARNVASDLSRELRAIIDGPEGRGRSAFSVVGAEYFIARFVTRMLIPDDKRSLRFGKYDRV